jgi:hypothetical protein
MRIRWPIFIVALLLVCWFGYWLASTAVPHPPTTRQKADVQIEAKITDTTPARTPRLRREFRAPGESEDDEALDAGALPGQRVLVFDDQAALERFLVRAGNDVRVLGRLDALNALRVGFSNADEFADLDDGDAQASLVYPVNIPAPAEGTVQDGAVGMGDGLLEWLGISGDNSAWGSGVSIAILDTGVTSNSIFSSKISAINLVDLPADLSTQNGHGTAVASMIIGNGSLTPGVAPGASILSIRIANDLGQSDSFLLAKGIVAAVDAGARLINISLGSPGDSGVVRNAIEYARAAGSIIVAASGNNGIDSVSYPAANKGVIAVGAVDALGNHLDFSNTGRQVAVSAPGYAINAAWTGNQAVSVSGTSFSSPIVVGAIAAVMSQPGSKNLTNVQAMNLVFAYLNDGGEAGGDEALGGGMPDMGRVLNRAIPGIYDAAVASQRIIPPSQGNPYGQVEVLVQNRGTEPLVNTAIQISTPAGVVNTNITSLAVNAVRTIRVPITRSTAEKMRFDSKVKLTDGVRDAKPSNDRRSETYLHQPVK